jgi:hypothetical protein
MLGIISALLFLVDAREWGIGTSPGRSAHNRWLANNVAYDKRAITHIYRKGAIGICQKKKQIKPLHFKMDEP